MIITSEKRTSWMLRYLLYPFLLAITCLYGYYAIQDPLHLGRQYGVYLFGMIAVMVAVEALQPLRTEWKMTKTTFFRRDLPFLLLGASTLALIDYVAGVIVINHSIAHPTWLAQLPLVLSIPLALLAKDFLWYWVHRASHQLPGPVGRFMWRAHVAHHLPQQVYVFMHAIGHPFDLILARIASALPLFFLGFSPETVFLALLFVSLQGLVSHFNVDIRAGWLNYFIVGTELHRYHHSADLTEVGNYGAVVTLWDQLFGTFRYRPNENPRKLGVDHPDAYPSDRAILKILALPFKPNA